MTAELGAWLRKFQRWYGGGLPRDYLVLDTETTGWKPYEDLPVDIGHAVVRDGELRHASNTVLNWVGYPGLDDTWLEERLARTHERMAAQNKHYPYTLDYLRQHGKEPSRVLRNYQELCRVNHEAGAAFLGHKLEFDVGMLEACWDEVCGSPWPVPVQQQWDTGGIMKAAQARVFPDTSHTSAASFFRWVAALRRSGIYWSLEHCVQVCGLESQLEGLGPLHDPRADAVMVHHIFEAYRLELQNYERTSHGASLDEVPW